MKNHIHSIYGWEFINYVFIIMLYELIAVGIGKTIDEVRGYFGWLRMLKNFVCVFLSKVIRRAVCHLSKEMTSEQIISCIIQKKKKKERTCWKNYLNERKKER